MLDALFLVDFEPTANSLRVSRLYSVIRHFFACLSFTAACPCVHAAAGVLLIAAYLPASWPVRFIDENVTQATAADLDWAEFVFVSGMHIQASQIHEIAKRAKRAGKVIDGLQLLDSLKQEHPELPVVMISGHGNIETAVSAIKRGAYDFIEKSFKADRLMLAAERAVESSAITADVGDQVAPSSLWSVEEQTACFVVRDGNREVFATVYYEQDPVGRAATKLPTKDEAHRIAVQLARLSELLDTGELIPTQMSARGFPLPWSVEDIGDAFVVRDSTRQKLAYVYYEEDPGRRRAAKLLTKDEAQRFALNVANLPGRLGKTKISAPRFAV
jgi:DNA-binding NarL/FixJ family response regulator